jgi:hypothetical protein
MLNNKTGKRRTVAILPGNVEISRLQQGNLAYGTYFPLAVKVVLI